MAPFEKVRFDHAGDTLEGEIARPEGEGPFPVVLMFPGATGPGDTFRARARDLASHGWLAVMADMYGASADISTPEAAGACFMAMLETPDRLRDRTVAWLAAARELPGADGSRVAALGWCFGGKCVLELARSGADLLAVVSFHGLLTTHAPARRGDIVPTISVWSGGQDPYAPVLQLDDLRAELDAAEADYHVTLFAKAQHSFTDPDHDGIQPGIAFDPMASSIAWSGTLVILNHRFKD